MTAAERLVSLAGTTGTAGALLLLIGTGATAGAALADHSGLATGTAAEHLLVDRVADEQSASGAVWLPRRKPVDEDAAILLAILL